MHKQADGQFQTDVGKNSFTYPDYQAEPEKVFSLDMLHRTTATLFSWQQAPGAFGGIHLHACWGISSALTRRYHGQSIYMTYSLLKGAMRLFEITQENRWRLLAGELVMNVLFLKLPDGGFQHTSGEFEPTYDGTGAPIHQCFPLLGILDYAAWPHRDPLIAQEIRPAIDAHWQWLQSYWWRRGNEFIQPLDHPGWCGVTNQDLVAIAALALYGKVYGDYSRYEQFGKPALDVFISPRYYHERMGMFERGDEANFVERVSYNGVIIPMLDLIAACTGDDRLSPIANNVTRRLFDAIFVHTDKLHHLAWGATTDSGDKTKSTGWIYKPLPFCYPEFLLMMEKYLAQHSDAVLEEKKRALERTLAAYVFHDGTIPTALNTEPLFAVVAGPGAILSLWLYLIEKQKNNIKTLPLSSPGVIHRRCNGVCWKSNDKLWSIEKDGRRIFAAHKRGAHNVVVGPEADIPQADLRELDVTPIVEEIRSDNE